VDNRDWPSTRMNSIAGLEVAVGDWASVDAFRGRRSNTICSSPVPTETTAFGVTSVVSLASLQVLGGKHEQHIDGAASGLVINGCSMRVATTKAQSLGQSW
jgi:hypothetical protein